MAADRAADAARLKAQLAANPGDAVAWHNLASAEGDLGNAAQAESAARRALTLGLAAPETRMVLARALQDQGRLEEAERMFLECLALRPAYAQAHRDLAQLRWMRSGSASEALSALDAAIAGAPADPGLQLVRSIVLEFAGDLAGAAASAQAGLAHAPASLELLQQMAHVRCELGEGAAALACARKASALAPGDPAVGIVLCEALLAAGKPLEAGSVALALREAHPLDQHAIALQATAWRLLGDPRYAGLHDYAALVGCERLEPPQGWPSLSAFLADVSADLSGLHRFRMHPFQQSVRGGGQLPLHAAELARPVVRAFFDAIGVAVRRRLAACGTGGDPFRSRNTGRFAVTGAWSVRLASGGFHADHVHPRGWLSGVCYLDVPVEVESSPDRAGWLRLGRPGIRTSPAMAADHFVKPEPGLLALFPAYMWHGVEPFQSACARLTVAFDALPG